MFDLYTPISYVVVTLLWLIILIVCLVNMRNSRLADAGITVLLTIVALDAFRTVFENFYFGLFHNSRFGLLPAQVAEVLGRTDVQFIPKTVNIATGILVLVLLVRYWLPRELGNLRRTKHNEAILHSVFDDAAVGMVLHAPDGSKRERVNDAFCRLVGHTREDLLTSPYAALTHPDDLAESLELRGRLARGEVDTIAMEKRYVHADGHSVWGGVSASVIRDEDGKVLYYVSFVQDISARKAAERSLKEATESAVEANRAKSRFLATMSHEFRTPLNAILGFSEMLRREVFGPLGDPRYREYATNVRNSGDLMLALVNDVLDISAIEAGKRALTPEEIDLAEIIEDCVRNFAPLAADRSVAITMELEGPLPIISADRRSVTQILLNLLSNAIKFTEPGGRVTVGAARVDCGVRLCVEDTGVGIPAAALASVTEPFTRTHANPHLAQEGTGLGLSIVKALAEAHNATLDIDSIPARGTSVTIVFPALT